MAEGYEAFFSCTRTSNKGRVGYSGVVTFCRVNSAFTSNEVALPLAAEEGFTGLLFKSGDAMTKGSQFKFHLEDLEEITKEDLLKVDSEGRCIITDHGHFVLFNIYGPRAAPDDVERLNFKHKFFKLLQKRWETLLSEGRRVFVVGDLNIAPSAIDWWDAGPDFEKNPFREWLRSMLKECGGPFFDVFRTKHPQRKDAYTCWSANNGAEEFDCGSRIDLILISGPCLDENHEIEGHNFVDCHVKECDILKQLKRWKPGNIPRGKGGKSVKLEGSDHVPVYVCLDEIPNLPAHSTPSLAARYVPEVRGMQQTIVSLLMKREETLEVKNHEVPLSTCEIIKEGSCTENKGSHSSLDQTPSSLETQEFCGRVDDHMGNVFCEMGKEKSKTMMRNERRKLVTLSSMKEKKKARHRNSSQLTLRSFFQQDKPRSNDDPGSANNDFPLSQVDSSEGDPVFCDEPKERDSYNETSSTGNGEESSSQNDEFDKNVLCEDQASINACGSSEKMKSNAALEWQRIQEMMQRSVPLCKGHREPCVARTVKKAGPNVGRGFYVCARAEGPVSNPEANCSHFQWASSKSKERR